MAEQRCSNYTICFILSPTHGKRVEHAVCHERTVADAATQSHGHDFSGKRHIPSGQVTVTVAWPILYYLS